MIALLEWGGLFMALAMGFAWIIQAASGNAGWVDVVWSFATGLLGVFLALMPVDGDATPDGRQMLVAALAAIWSLRLGFHLADRTTHGPEDSRYANFRALWGRWFQLRFFWFLEVQAAAAILLGISFVLAAHDPAPGLRAQDGLAALVLIVAIGGEAIADGQLRRFKTDPANRGRICDAGLWGRSRHPNYFFEWLGWLAYPLLAIDLGGDYAQGWFALIGPALMYLLLVHVSGIPPLERQMLRSRGDAFRAYRARTRAFIPWPKPEAP